MGSCLCASRDARSPRGGPRGARSPSGPPADPNPQRPRVGWAAEEKEQQPVQATAPAEVQDGLLARLLTPASSLEEAHRALLALSSSSQVSKTATFPAAWLDGRVVRGLVGLLDSVLQPVLPVLEELRAAHEAEKEPLSLSVAASTVRTKLATNELLKRLVGEGLPRPGAPPT
eukprot:RCo040301